MDAESFYETHRQDCIEWGIPAPPSWSELSPKQQAGWERAATEYAEKMLHDRKEAADA